MVLDILQTLGICVSAIALVAIAISALGIYAALSTLDENFAVLPELLESMGEEYDDDEEEDDDEMVINNPFRSDGEDEGKIH